MIKKKMHKVNVLAAVRRVRIESSIVCWEASKTYVQGVRSVSSFSAQNNPTTEFCRRAPWQYCWRIYCLPLRFADVFHHCGFVRSRNRSSAAAAKPSYISYDTDVRTEHIMMQQRLKVSCVLPLGMLPPHQQRC